MADLFARARPEAGENTEEAMRFLLDRGIWPTATELNRVGRYFGLRRGRVYLYSRRRGHFTAFTGRRDLNGPECRLRERLAAEYGWRRKDNGRVTRWERAGG